MPQFTHVGVYAFILANERIALIRKSRGPYTGAWDLPGGRIEFGEAPLVALAREVEEEVGLTMVKAIPRDILSIRADFDNDHGEPTELHHLALIFNAQVEAPNALRRTGDAHDASEANWFTLEAARALPLTPLTHAVLNGDATYHRPNLRRCEITRSFPLSS